MISLVSLFSSTAHKLSNLNLYYPSPVGYTEKKIHPTHSNLSPYNTFFAVRCCMSLLVFDRMEQGSEESNICIPYFQPSPYSDLTHTVYSISLARGAVKPESHLMEGLPSRWGYVEQK